MADSLDMKLEVKGDKEIEKFLSDVGLAVSDLKGAMEDVGTHAIKTFSGQVFASRGQILNQPWPRLSEPYASWKAKRFGGKIPLVRGGRGSEDMRGSFKSTASKMSVEINNTASYFKYHQSSKPRKKIPRRVMLGVYKGMQDDVTDVIATALSRKIKRAG